MTIYFLNVENDENMFTLPFSTMEKGIDFIKNNFNYDSPRKVCNELWEGKTNKYVITSHMLDQQTF